MDRDEQLDAMGQLWVEARLALALHNALDEIFPATFREYLDWSRAPDGEPWDTMRTLIRRYPTKQDALDVEERIWQTALREMQIQHAEQRMEGAEDRAERARIARSIDEMRREPITLVARPPRKGA